LDHQAGPDLHGRLSNHGIDRHHHSLGGQYVFSQFCHEHDYQYIGVIVFVGLTAYDTQHLKTMAMNQPDGVEAAVVRKGAILGALKLYLDFINLFLMLLRIFGSGRD
jgi:hypothetical protein